MVKFVLKAQVPKFNFQSPHQKAVTMMYTCNLSTQDRWEAEADGFLSSLAGHPVLLSELYAERRCISKEKWMLSKE